MAGKPRAFLLLWALLVMTASGARSEWQCQHQGSAHRLLTEVHFVDTQNGWCVGHVTEGESGAVLKTNDGGENWVDVDTGFLFGHAWAVHFVSPQEGWIAGGDCASGQHGFIIHTTDGGQSWEWQIQYWSLPFTRFYGLDFVDEDHGWAAVGGQNARVYRTTNGGTLWQESLPEGLDDVSHLCGIHFEDVSTGWVVGGHENPTYDHGVIYRTTDGGVTWEQQGEEIQSILDDVCLYDVWFVDASRGWIVGGANSPVYGVILHTEDGGDTWASQAFDAYPEPARLGGVCFADPMTGWAVGAEYCDSIPAVYGTTNGGQTWVADPGVGTWPLDVPFNGIHFLDAANGWIVGDDMRVVKYSQQGDVEPPAQVAGLTSTPVNGSDMLLQWAPSTDNVGVAGYRVYRSVRAYPGPLGSVLIATTESTAWTDFDVLGNPAIDHYYVVRAYDEASNESPSSQAVGEKEYGLVGGVPSSNSDPW